MQPAVLPRSQASAAPDSVCQCILPPLEPRLSRTVPLAASCTWLLSLRAVLLHSVWAF